MKESHRMILVKNIFPCAGRIHYLQQVNHCNTINRQKFGFITGSLCARRADGTVYAPLWIGIAIIHIML